jgi:hypothetical protein
MPCERRKLIRSCIETGTRRHKTDAGVERGSEVCKHLLVGRKSRVCAGDGVVSIKRNACVMKERVACDDEICDALSLRLKPTGSSRIHHKIAVHALERARKRGRSVHRSNAIDARFCADTWCKQRNLN